MSVNKSKRQTSSLQFLETAHNIKMYTIKRIGSFPKRMLYIVSIDLKNEATTAFHRVKEANSIYPVNQHEVQRRRDKFQDAICAYEVLISDISDAYELFQFSDNVMNEWMNMIEEELKLIKGIMKNDRKRYKDLPVV